MQGYRFVNGRAAGGHALGDVVVADGVVRLGGDDEGLEVVDLDGRFVIPGLWDQHVHMTQWAIYARRLDLGATTSAAECATACRQAADGVTEPVLGYGIRPQLWPDEPTGALLDEACGNVPVVVACMDLHSCWANSAAIAHYGMHGLEAGLLTEEQCFEMMRRMAALPDDVLDAWVAESAGRAAARGIVGIVDMEMAWNLPVWQRRMASGFDAFRVRASVYPQWLDEPIALGVRTGDVDPALPLLAMGPLKCISDGSLNTKTAYCHDAYPGEERSGCACSHGVMTFSGEQVGELMARATAHGIECAIHAIGDAANTICLDQFERTGARGRIEHAQLLTDADVARFARLGVVASVQPQHALDDRETAAAIWPGREGRMYRFRDLLDAGATLAFGSDAPVAPLDPWHQVQGAVERALPGDEPFVPEQCLTAAEALAASTDGHGTSLVDGMAADLAIVDADPLHARAVGLREMPVSATLVAGRPTHWTL